jgi:hypothetical protein
MKQKIDIKKKVLEVDELVFSSCDIQDFFLCVHHKQL